MRATDITCNTVLIASPATQIDQEKLKTENTGLVAAFREKSRKHQQTQELYDRLKRKEMTSATQTAAYNSVDEVLGSISQHQEQKHPSISRQYQIRPGPEESQAVFPEIPADYQEEAQPHSHSTVGSNNSHGDSRMMPPPSYRTKRNETKAPDNGISGNP